MLLSGFSELRKALNRRRCKITEPSRFAFIDCFYNYYRTVVRHRFNIGGKFLYVNSPVCWYKVIGNKDVMRLNRAPRNRGKLLCQLKLHFLPTTELTWAYMYTNNTHEKIMVYKRMKQAMKSLNVSTEKVERWLLPDL